MVSGSIILCIRWIMCTSKDYLLSACFAAAVAEHGSARFTRFIISPIAQICNFQGHFSPKKKRGTSREVPVAADAAGGGCSHDVVYCTKKPPVKAAFWWGMVDSDHRRHCQQIYSLSPLATREIPHIQLLSGGAGRRTRTPDLLITNQLLCH